jgi:phosphoribosylglycinamide formyltransferase-1
MKKIAVLISNAGSGTNLQAIIDAIEDKKLIAKIEVVVSDASDAYGLERSKKANIPTHIFNSKEEKLEELLTKKYSVDFIALNGWKKIISPETISAFPNKILNIHPGLIPDKLDGIVKNPDGTDGLWNRGKFTGVAVQNFLDSKATYAGSTVHFLSNEFDFGKVLGRCFEKIQPDDTVESLYSRLKQKENKIYVEALITLCK